jgi:hypothetical protein
MMPEEADSSQEGSAMRTTACALTDAQLNTLADLARGGQQPELLVWLGPDEKESPSYPLVAFKGPAGSTLTGLLLSDGTFDASTLGVLPGCPDTYEYVEENAGDVVDAQ